MESGLDLYYNGNTVIPPAPGMKRKWRTIQQPVLWDFREKVMQPEPKICATSQCIWCNQSFGNRYMVVCPRCRNCQYCGLMCTSSLNACALCENYLPPELVPMLTVLTPNK